MPNPSIVTPILSEISAFILTDRQSDMAKRQTDGHGYSSRDLSVHTERDLSVHIFRDLSVHTNGQTVGHG